MPCRSDSLWLASMALHLKQLGLRSQAPFSFGGFLVFNRFFCQKNAQEFTTPKPINQKTSRLFELQTTTTPKRATGGDVNRQTEIGQFQHLSIGPSIQGIFRLARARLSSAQVGVSMVSLKWFLAPKNLGAAQKKVL